MSIPPTAPGRGAAAFLPQPVSHTDQLAAQSLVETVYYYNAREIRPPLADVEYRSSDRESDILHHVFRWDVAPYQFVFENGFKARRQANTPDITYFNLERYIHAGGRPLDTRRETTYAFVSTTLSSSWNPQIKSGKSMELYRYEIYAPGGVWVAETLEDQYRFKAQDEVTFIAGIAPQYIRSAQLFQLRGDGQHTKKKRVNTILYVNKNFNPQSSPPRNLRILRPVSDYIDETTKQRKKLTIQKFPAVKSLNNSTNIDYYIDEVTQIDGYIDSCFRSVRTNEVYLFMEKEFVIMDYAPDTKKDRVINGPLFISNGFGSLIGTAFANYGIDAAFGCHGVSEAFIFSANVCAKFNYSPGNTNDRIVEGPKTIKQMFPFFKGTNFAQGIDAGFESTRTGEAYLFKGGEYALINYPKRALLAKGNITDAFSCLRETMFASGVGAAFASHKPNEAYLFKDNTYVLIYFTPGEKKDRIIAGPKELVPSTWPSLRGILPHKNRGVDVVENAKPDPPRDQDD